MAKPMASAALTEGSVIKNLVNFSIPFLISNLLQMLYNVVDMIIVGHLGSTVGISAISIGGQVTTLVVNAVIGLANGGLILVSQFFGAKKDEDLKQTIGTLFSLFLFISVFVAIVFSVFAGPIIRLLSTPAEVYAQARSYLIICMVGAPFIFGYNGISAVLRGMGDSRHPMYFVAIATVINIVLDVVFVGTLKWGAAGAAVATVIAQGASLGMALWMLRRLDFVFTFSFRNMAIHRDKLRLLLRIGLPSSIQQTLVQLSFMSVVALANSYGLAASTMFGIGNKLNTFANLPCQAIMASIASIAGQCVGARKPDRALQTAKIGAVINFCITVMTTAAVVLLPETFVRVFTDDAQVLAISAPFLRRMVLDYTIVGVTFCFTGLANGAGHTMFSLAVTITCSVVMRIPLAYLFAHGMNMGFNGVGLAMGLAPWSALPLLAWFFHKKLWEKPVMKL